MALLHVMSKYRDEDLSQVDFVFGGSALDVLANQRVPNDCTYVVCRVPHTNAVIVKKHKVYTCDLTAPGFQFECLVTGNNMENPHNTSFVEHLQLMEIGNFRVLFSAQVDAVDANLAAVEVKISNTRN